MKVVFHVNNHRESIYRGSTRLGPLYIEMQEQKKRLEAPNKTIARRNTAFNRNKPYVEYTRNADDEASGPGQEPVKRAVARKSTTALKKPDSSAVEPKERWDYKGKVAPVEVLEKVEGIPFVKHQVNSWRVLPGLQRCQFYPIFGYFCGKNYLYLCCDRVIAHDLIKIRGA